MIVNITGFIKELIGLTAATIQMIISMEYLSRNIQVI